MDKHNLALALALGVALATGAAPASAANAVTNGGFEDTASIAGSGWTASGGLSEGTDFYIDSNPGDAHAAGRSFAGGTVGDLGFISQDIATTAGTSYDIRLWLANLSGFADGTALQILWGGNVVYATTDVLGFGYQEIVVNALATAASTTLAIGLRDDSFYLNVDDVSVNAVAAVPEPASVVLMAVGLAGVGLLRRRVAAKT